MCYTLVCQQIFYIMENESIVLSHGIANLLQEYGCASGLPLVKGIGYKIDLISGANLLNHSTFTRAKED